jgi:gliding motility-associated protein GldL
MEKIVNVIASFAAAVVIVGALFKILHWKGADEALMIGMFVEAFIFILYGVLYLVSKPEKSYDWEKVYPELSKNYQGEPIQRTASGPSSTGAGMGLAAKMDEMFASTKVSPDVFDNLTKGMKALTDNVSKMTDLTDASVATSDYAKNVKAASNSLNDMSKSYSSTIGALTDMSAASQGAKEYQAQFQKVTQSMGALNAVYELELQDTNKHLKAMNSFYGNLTVAMENMSETSKDTQQFKQELAKLNSNIASLNNVYGSMLSAMKGN